MLARLLPLNCIPNRPLTAVGGAIIHYFSGKNVDISRQFHPHVCRDLFLDLNRDKSEREAYMLGDVWPDKRMYASAHVLISRGGHCWQLVDYGQQAYHAGASALQGRSNCNEWTLGIELIGSQHSGFTAEQYSALAVLLLELQGVYGFPREMIAGHDTVRYAAIRGGQFKKYKYDPSGRLDGQGNNFEWSKLWRTMDFRAN